MYEPTTDVDRSLDWDAPACWFLTRDRVLDGRVVCGKPAAGYVICDCPDCNGARIPLCEACFEVVKTRLSTESP